VQIRRQKTASLLLLGIGLGLLLMMILVEDEFGALPLALVFIGAVWYGRCSMRERRGRRR
jgi:hypothetical protein